MLQTDPDWRKTVKQLEDFMKNIKKTNENDKKKSRVINDGERRLTGEPEGPGGPLVPASP